MSRSCVHAELGLDRGADRLRSQRPGRSTTTPPAGNPASCVSMLSQMGMMSILALSYNMLLGQAGLFSLCHATFFGIGGYATMHFLNMRRRRRSAGADGADPAAVRPCPGSGLPSCSATWRPSSAPPRLP